MKKPESVELTKQCCPSVFKYIDYLEKQLNHGQSLPIENVSKSFYCECEEPLEIQYEVGLTIYCENCGKNVKQ